MSPAGRHRAQNRPNPVATLSAAVSRGARPAVSVTACLAAAGGMVVGLTAPANAAPAAPAVSAADSVVLSGAPGARVSYGLQVVNPAPATVAKTTFSPVAFTSRGHRGHAAAKPATVAAAHTAAVAKPAAVVNYSPKSAVLGIASSLSGIPYRWGGTTTAGFDCSGFTQYVYRQAGVSLPRTAGAQRAATAYVSNPQPGDLVFFGTYHVGIYAGGGMMYDAPSSGQTTGLHRIWSSAVTYGRV